MAQYILGSWGTVNIMGRVSFKCWTEINLMVINTKLLLKGQFVDGRKVGYGVMTLANGVIYKGEWKDDKKCGQGEEIFPN